MVRFDGYTATMTTASYKDLVDLFGPGLEVKPGPGFHQFGHRLALKDDTGSEVGSVSWGGGQGTRSMIEVKGERTPQVVDRLRAAFEHRCTRVDSCVDFESPGVFDRLLGTCMEVKKRYRLMGERRGDWEDFPEKGRTQYLGSVVSVARLRLYEKGKQPEYQHLGRADWVRAELQVRPVKQAKARFSEMSALDVWGASKWSRELAADILEKHVDRAPAGTVWKLTERDKALAWMCKQYGAHMVGLAADLGSWECLGLTLRDMIDEQKK